MILIWIESEKTWILNCPRTVILSTCFGTMSVLAGSITASLPSFLIFERLTGRISRGSNTLTRSEAVAFSPPALESSQNRNLLLSCELEFSGRVYFTANVDVSIVTRNVDGLTETNITSFPSTRSSHSTSFSSPVIFTFCAAFSVKPPALEIASRRDGNWS